MDGLNITNKKKYQESCKFIVEYEKAHRIKHEQEDIEKSEYFKCYCDNEILCVTNSVEFSDEGRRFSQEFQFAIFENHHHTKTNLFQRIKYACLHLWTGKKFKDNIILEPKEIKKLILFLQKELK